MSPRSEPDPSWHYASIWRRLQESNFELNALLDYMASVEEKSVETDKAIKGKLDNIGQELNSTRRLLDE